ncbi:restriction endonuclease subunit S [Deinococcus lacus]|uniref:Restriction endonuclease subunit S n=1 Tax=Deinococcus lacus TaxID=392561 RepID=A0ABW1YCW8_9DEIO
MYGGNGIIGYSDKSNAPKGTIIVGRVGEKCGNVRVSEADCWVTDNALMVNEYLRPVDVSFIHHSLDFAGLSQYRKKGGQPLITQSGIGIHRLFFPPLPEQRKIAAILSTWDDSLATLARLIAAKQQQKRGLAEALLTGKKRLPGFEGEWEVVRLGEVADVTMGSSPSSTAYNDTAQGLPLIQGNADIKNRIAKPRVYTSEITKECRAGDIILSVRAPVGSVALTSVRACIGRGVASIRSLGSQDFLYQALVFKENAWGNLMQGSTFESVTGKEVKDFPIPLPPLPEQRAIASVLSTLDGETSALTQLRAALEQQKRGLMDVLLTGRVRVAVE